MTQTKAAKTTEFIIEKVAPIFNRNGYVGTSLSDITDATGLTKGAVYGNFDNKEHLAVEAFNFNIRKIVGMIAVYVNEKETAREKLQAITDFYRNYYQFTNSFGGCPILNVGIDSNHQNPALKHRVNEIIEKLVKNMVDILNLGIQTGDFKPDIDTTNYSKRIYSLIEGAVFTSIMMEDEEHLIDMMDFLDAMIVRDLSN